MAFWACSDNESNPAKSEVPEPLASSDAIPTSSSVVIQEPDSCGSFVDAHMFLVQPLDEVVYVGSAGKAAQYFVRCIKY